MRDCLGGFRQAREITCIEDLVFIVSTRPSDSVKLALRVQSRLRKELSPDSKGARIALHLGEVQVAEGSESTNQWGVFGDEVELASRVLELARYDQILMTRSVFDNARAILKGEDLAEMGGLAWLDHGTYKLVGIERPVGICEVGEEGIAPLSPPRDTDQSQPLCTV